MTSAIPSQADNDDELHRSPSNPRKPAARTILLIVGGIAAIVCLGVAVLVTHFVRESTRVAEAHQDLELLGIGALAFEDTYGHLPPLNSEEYGDSRPQLSWHYRLLPFTEVSHLFTQIDEQHSWDDAANAKVFCTIVPEFLQPRIETTTDAAGYGVAHYVPNSRLIRDNQGQRLERITDGSANTVLAGEINIDYPAWGDPANSRDAANGFAGGPDAFGSTGSAVAVLMVDGSVRMVKPDLDAEATRRIATPDDGESIGEF